MNDAYHLLLISGRSDMGGGPRHMFDLLKSISTLYPSIKCYSSSPLDPPFASLFREHSRDHYAIPHRTFSILAFWGLLLFCKKNSINVVHSHGKAAGIYSRLLALFGLKVIHTFHGLHEHNGPIQKLKNYLEKALVCLTHAFICVSQSEAETAQSLGFLTKDRIYIINNAIDTSGIAAADPMPIRQDYQINHDKKLWGCLTRLSFEKGNDLLIRFLSQLELNDYHFILAGDGPQRSELEQLAERLGVQNIIFLGEIDHPIAFLKSLDGYISFSRGEGLPYSLLEALACELPCVLSRVKGHIDFASQVRLFDLDQPETFREALQVATTTPSPTPNNSLDAMTHAIVSTYSVGN